MELHIHVYRHHPDAAIRRQSTSSVPLALLHMNTPLLAQVFMLIYVSITCREIPSLDIDKIPSNTSN